jgi:hypothetical protein
LESIVFERDDRMQDHRLVEIAKATLSTPDAIPVVVSVIHRLKAAVANYTLAVHDCDQFILVLFALQPRAALNGFFAGDKRDRESGRRVIEHITMSDKNPLDGVPDDVMLAWCDEAPAERYSLIADVASYSCNAEKRLQWSSLARCMLERAPAPLAVLETFIERFPPIMWSGSRAQELEERVELLDALLKHHNKEIVAYAVEKRRVLAEAIARYRLQEAEEDRDRDERFED